jgi:L-iditol 2-dehydrogenase
MTPERMHFASKHADHIIDVSTQDLYDTAMSLSSKRGFDKVMVSVGQAQVAEQAIPLAARGGAVNFFAGLPRDARVTIDPYAIHYSEVRLVGSFGFAPHNFKRAVEALTSGAFDTTGLITRTVALDEMQDAFAASAAYQGIKTVAVFD